MGEGRPVHNCTRLPGRFGAFLAPPVCNRKVIHTARDWSPMEIHPIDPVVSPAFASLSRLPQGANIPRTVARFCTARTSAAAASVLLMHRKAKRREELIFNALDIGQALGDFAAVGARDPFRLPQRPSLAASRSRRKPRLHRDRILAACAHTQSTSHAVHLAKRQSISCRNLQRPTRTHPSACSAKRAERLGNRDLSVGIGRTGGDDRKFIATFFEMLGEFHNDIAEMKRGSPRTPWLVANRQQRCFPCGAVFAVIVLKIASEPFHTPGSEESVREVNDSLGSRQPALVPASVTWH